MQKLNESRLPEFKRGLEALQRVAFSRSVHHSLQTLCTCASGSVREGVGDCEQPKSRMNAAMTTDESPHLKSDGQRNASRGFVYRVLLVAIALLVFGRITNHEFVAWDDDQHVFDNPHLQQVSADQIAHFWQEPYFGLYIPLSYTLFAAETVLGRAISGDASGFDSRVFHAGSLVLHMLNTLLIFSVLKRLVRDDAAAFAGSLLFSLHPLQVESVAWVSETRGLLSGFFAIIAVGCYLSYADAGTPDETGQSLKSVWKCLRKTSYLCATLAFVCALFAKPTAVALPLMIAVIDRLMLNRPTRSIAVAMLPWLVIAASAVILNKSLQSDATINAVAPLWQRPFIAGDAIAFYFQKFVLPLDLSFDYGRSPTAVMQSNLIFVTWLVPAAAMAAVFLAKPLKQYRVALGISLAALLPVLGLIPFAHQEISTVADRYAYLALLGPALMMAVFVSQRRGVLFRLSMALLVLLSGISAFHQAGHWRDSATLFEHALAVNPRSFVACNNYGNVLLRANDVDEAIRLFHRAIDIKPEYAKAHYSLGVALIRINDDDQAALHLRESLRLDPTSARAHYDMAVLLNRQGAVDQAVSHYQAALERNPNDAAAHNNLGTILFQQGDITAATKHFRAALSADPGLIDARVNLGNLLIVHGDAEAAIAHYRAALRGRSNLPHVHANLGRHLLRQGQLEQAAQHFRFALELLPADADIHFDLGVVYNRQQRFEMAAKAYETALKLAPKHAPAHLNLGILLHLQQRTELAIEHLNQALECDPALSLAHNTMGIICHEQQRLAEAVPAL